MYKLKTYNDTCKNMINLKVKLLEMETEIDGSKPNVQEPNVQITEDSEESEESEDLEDIVPVPDERSVINIMKRALSKQSESKQSESNKQGEYNKQGEKYDINKVIVETNIIKKYCEKRPKDIKLVFNSDTLIRHKEDNKCHYCPETKKMVYKTFEILCYYIKNENKFYRASNVTSYNINQEIKTLSQFILDNYKQQVDGYNHKSVNTYAYLEYFCKIDNIFKPFKEIYEDSIID